MKTKQTSLGRLDWIMLAGICAALIYFGYRLTIGLNYHWHWATLPQYLFRFDPEKKRWVANLLMQGLFTTIRLSIWGTLLATLLGALMGLCRVSSRLFNRLVGRTYVELIRNLPPLVLIFIFYYFFSDQIIPALGLDAFIRNSPETTRRIFTFLWAPPAQFPVFISALLTLAIFEGAYITEIVRAGIESVDTGQWEAAYSLGLSRWQQLRHVILPQATQRILPPLAGQFISTIKDSSIVSVISIQELTFQGMELMSATYMTFEVWITITLLYFLLTFPCSAGVHRLERYLRRHEA